MKNFFKSLVFLPFITLMGCGVAVKYSREGVIPIKESNTVEFHFGPSPGDGYRWD